MTAARAAAAPAEPTHTLELFPAAPQVKAGTKEEFVHIAIAELEPDPANPRTDADDELAESIRQAGVLQPITVRPHPDPERVKAGKRYMIVYGERRYRGSIKAGRTTIPAIIRDERDEDRAHRLVRQFQENFHKKLEPLQEAQLLKEVRDATGFSVEQLEKISGKPKSTINDRLALADAPAAFKPLFVEGALSAAAAPIIRKYIDVPAEILERAVSSASSYYQWREAIHAGRPIALNNVESVLKNVILGDGGYNAGLLAEIPDKLSLLYQGPKITIGKKEYATDYKAFEKVKRQQQEEEAAEAKAKEKQKSTKSNKTTTAKPSPAELKAKEAEKKQREKEAKENAKRSVENARWKTAAPQIEEAFFAALKKAPATATSAIADELFMAMGTSSWKSLHDELWFDGNAAKFAAENGISRGKTAEDFLRHVTACLLAKDIELLYDGDEQARERVTDAIKKLELKVDIKKIVDAVKEPEFDGAKKPAKAASKKKGKK
jgi:ParB/RepB/Spo0J family partition protein